MLELENNPAVNNMVSELKALDPNMVQQVLDILMVNTYSDPKMKEFSNLARHLTQETTKEETPEAIVPEPKTPYDVQKTIQEQEADDEDIESIHHSDDFTDVLDDFNQETDPNKDMKLMPIVGSRLEQLVKMADAFDSVDPILGDFMDEHIKNCIEQIEDNSEVVKFPDFGAVIKEEEVKS